MTSSTLARPGGSARVSLPFALLLLLTTLGVPAQSAGGRLWGHTPNPRAVAARLGAVDSRERIDLALTLPLRNQPQLDDLLVRLHNPKDPLYGRYLSSDEFRNRFSPTERQYAAVAAFARSRGLSVTGTHANRLILNVSGPAGTVERAFDTRLSRFRARSGRVFHAPEQEPAVPAGLAGVLSGVVGLDNLALHRPHLRRREPPALQARAEPQETGSGPGGGLSPSDIRTAYNLAGTSLNGAGQTLAVFELDGYTASDIAQYVSRFGLRSVPLQNVMIDGFNGRPGAGADEVTLDIELQIALAQGAAKILVYEGPNTNVGVLDTYNRIASDNLAKQASTSWGLPELENSASALRSESAIFQQMAAQGQSIFAASGDSGAFDDGRTLSVDDPASQPFVTGVGGTTLSTSGPGGTWAAERTWNGGSASVGGGGGGISQFWALPSYQQGAVSGNSKGSTTARNVPDVSLDADPNTGYAIFTGGRWEVFGGTSCASPLWAAFTALVNQQRAARGLSSAGFLNPEIYEIGQGTRAGGDFHDIADGSTNLFYPAVTDYDDATGWGTFNGAELLADLSAPPAAGAVSVGKVTVSPRSQPAAGGTVSASVTVASDLPISTVSVTATPTSGTPVTGTLARVDSTTTYSGSIDLPANSAAGPLSYRLTIHANDTGGNSGTADGGTVAVAGRDTTGPAITTCDVTPRSLPPAGEQVTISATVTDGSGVSAVLADVTKPDTTITTVRLTAKSAGLYTAAYSIPKNTSASPQTYRFRIRAGDNLGNISAADCGIVTVAAGDTVPPSVTACSISPLSLPSVGGVVTITATVTDNVAVSDVTAIIQKPDGTTATYALAHGSGNNWSTTYTAAANTTATVQIYNVTLRAVDTSSNAMSANCGSFKVAVGPGDLAAPVLSGASLKPTVLPSKGGKSRVRVTVTDNKGVASVTATVTRLGSVVRSVTLKQISGSLYQASIPFAKNKSRTAVKYDVVLVAADVAGNKSAGLDAGTVTVKRR